jgi:hypothetical protein
MKNQKAIEATIAATDRARTMLARIAEQIDALTVTLEDQPESVHWGHVGDAEHIASVLAQLIGEDEE